MCLIPARLKAFISSLCDSNALRNYTSGGIVIEIRGRVMMCDVAGAGDEVDTDNQTCVAIEP